MQMVTLRSQHNWRDAVIINSYVIFHWHKELQTCEGTRPQEENWIGFSVCMSSSI